ncbi:hypothetical protein, partial [Acinetobacter pittii]|uniref:hypothetical protein n=1 Tax=Acinetobacter pittii TaxID=48296 RepID=UPI003330665F
VTIHLNAHNRSAAAREQFERDAVYGGKKTTRASLTATDTLNVATIKDEVEILSTADAPKYQGTNWFCFVHPHQSRTLRDDPAWVN